MQNKQNESDNIVAAYKRLVSKEDELLLKAKTCESVIELIIRDLLANGANYHLLTVEALLNAMQSVQEEVLVELSLTRISISIWLDSMW